MSGRKFKRSIRLTVTRQSTANFIDEVDTTVIRDLRVTFQIEKHLGKEPNDATITVYNLAGPSRAELQQRPIGVRLEVAYDGEFERLFEGDLHYAFTTRDGADVVTKLQVGDGHRAYNHARVSKSFAPGTKFNDVIGSVIGSMGLSKGAGSLDDVVNKVASGGATLHGPSRRELTRILDAHGKSWSVQDGQLQVLGDGEALPDDPIDIAPPPDGHMIGDPEFGAPKKAGGKPVLTVKTLLDPRLRCGGQFNLTSKDVKGLFRIESLKLIGDTHGTDWTSTVEGRAR